MPKKSYDQLKEEVEAQGRVIGELRRGTRSLEHQSGIYIEELARLRKEIQALEENLLLLAGDNFDLADRVDRQRRELSLWRSRLTPRVKCSRNIAGQWEVVVGELYMTFPAQETAQAVVDGLMDGLDQRNRKKPTGCRRPGNVQS